MADERYCLCGLKYDPNVFMIQCDACRDWFHSSCANFEEVLAAEVDKYHCPRCEEEHGPSIIKPFRNYHRHDYWDDNADAKPVQTGTRFFISELLKRHFHHIDDIVIRLAGRTLTESYLTQHGFTRPILVDEMDGLGMVLPDASSFGLHDVERLVGSDHEIDVIDVIRQVDVKMKLGDFVAYYASGDRTKVYNVVSLEFSKTPMTRLVEPPLAARDLDWANIIWPQDYALDQLCVQKYCLMSVKDSFTDFHIDFGGTSVWYHVLRGAKIFYLIAPTAANMTLYQQWMTSSNQSETFFGDQVDRCYRCELVAGQTMMIPTGWIHAVLTIEDSLVFGGNFLHSLNIPLQLQVYEIEKKVKMIHKFLYPYFETIHWFAAQRMLAKLQKINMEGGKCEESLLSSLKMLIVSLKAWNTDKESLDSQAQIPQTLNVVKFFKDISKEIRTAERHLNALNPPKPERESKRNRKRPVNKDFVDFSALKKLPARSPPPKPVVKPPAWPSPPPQTPAQPETATAVHRGGTILKIKLGKESFPVVGTPPAPGQRDELGENFNESFDSSQHSIYDFCDDDDDDSLDDSFNLYIDEHPRAAAKKQNHWTTKIIEEENPANGIESLLKASALATKFIDRGGEGRASPSTQEAIAGMLSIGQATTTFLQPSKKASAKNRKRLLDAQNLFEDEELHNVRQDDDYIYPPIENEEIKSSKDEAWSPHREGPLLPKVHRSTKKDSVDATSKRSKSPLKKSTKKKKLKIKQVDEANVLKTGISPGPSTLTPVPSSTPCITSSSSTTPATPARTRKGMKTVKQRLGKILKIHKMMH